MDSFGLSILLHAPGVGQSIFFGVARMESLRYSRAEHPFPIRQVRYDPPSPLQELRHRLASTVENDDARLEDALVTRLERLFVPGTAGGGRRRAKVVRFAPSEAAPSHRRPANALLPADPNWPVYVARFLVHFVKGVFFGAGMFTMDRLLVTHRLQYFLAWLYRRLFAAANSVETSGGGPLID